MELSLIVSPIYNYQTDVWKQKFLPDGVAGLYVEGERVAAVTRTRRVFIFTWSGQSVELDLKDLRHALDPPDTASPRPLLPQVLFHPTDGSVYLTWIRVYKQPREYLPG